MGGVLTGFGVIAAIAAAGYVAGHFGALGVGAEVVLSRFVFFIATPMLLLRTLAQADVGSVLASGLIVTAVSVVAAGGTFVLVARLAWQRSWAEATVGGLASSYVNAVNLGVPIAVYVLDDAAYVVPVLLLQLAVLTPMSLAVLDTAARSSGTGWLKVLSPLANPLTIACAAGLALGLTGVTLPDGVMRPVDLLAQAAVPVALVAFGVSLSGAPLPGIGGSPRLVWLAVGLKSVAQPAVAYLFASLALGTRGTALLAATVTAALPTAQNVLVYATRYGSGIPLARDAILLTTLASLPVILGVAALLG